MPDQRFSGCRLVLVDEAAQDRSTPDPAINRLRNRRGRARRPQPQCPIRPRGVVKSVRGAVPVFRPARFPDRFPNPPCELSPQRALRKPQVGLPDPLVQLGLDLQYPSSAGRERPPDRRCSPAQPPDLPWTSAVGLLDPFAVCGAFLRSDYYGSSAPSRGPGSATGLPTSGLAARGEGDRGMVPTFTS